MLRALLIAIDQYAGNVSSLEGCVADQQAWVMYLHAHCAPEALCLRTLTNEEATRENIINTFRQHLVQATEPGDTVLLVFCGHGATEPAPPAFDNYFSSRTMETTVCYDSRMPGGNDIADKEWASLLNELPDTIRLRVVFDACHSGSGTRNGPVNIGRARLWTDRRQHRDLSELLGFSSGHVKTYSVPSHAFFAACTATQVAWEHQGRGVFSKAILSVLATHGPGIKTGQLYQQLLQEMSGFLREQRPQLTLYGNVFPKDGFLEASPAVTKHWLPIRQVEGICYIPLGKIHGFADGDEITVFTTPAAEYPGETLKISRAGFQESIIDILPSNIKGGYWEGDAALEVMVADEELRQAAQTWFSTTRIALVGPHQSSSEWELKRETGLLSLYQINSDFRLLAVRGDDNQSVLGFWTAFQKIAHYQNLLSTSGRETDWQDKVGFELGILAKSKQVEWLPGFTHEFHFYPTTTGAYDVLPFRLRAWNHSNQALFFAVFLLTPDYGIHRLFADTSPVKAHTSTISVLEQEEGALLGVVNNSPPQVEDVLLLITSTVPLDPLWIVQGGINPYGGIVEAAPQRAVGRKQTSSFSVSASWTVQRISIQLVREKNNFY